MKWRNVWICGLIACGTCGACGASDVVVRDAPAQLDLANLPAVLEELVSCHPGQKKLDEEVLIRSHEKLFSLFDPEKIYLLDSEVAPFVHPKNGKRFLEEYRQKKFTTYYKMLDLCRAAVRRCRTVRTGFFFTDSHTLDNLRARPMPVYDRYAASPDELTERIFQKYVRLIIERLPEAAEDDSKKVRAAVMVAERQMEDHEHGWLDLDARPGASEQQRSAAARVILKAIISSVDAHSDVMEERGARDIRERLTKESFGTGIVPHVDAEGCFVKKIIRGSPADHSGAFHVNDRIESLDRRRCSEMSAAEIADLLNKEVPGSVLVAVSSPTAQGKKRVISVPRARYTVLEGRVEIRKKTTPYGPIAIIALHSFYRGGPGVSSSEDVRRALQEAASRGPLAGVILDLRDNTGGYITEAVRVVGEFIKTGVVMTACYADGSKLVFRDINPDSSFSGPMIVLTSKATASAAEIVAQTLKDYGRAIIVGDPATYGKGSIQMQTVTDMREKDVWVNIPLRFTVGRYYSVSGYSPQMVGVKADIVVPGIIERPMSEEEVLDGRLKERIDPLFQDYLDDVRLEVKGWYQEHYLPFLQKHTDRYRRWIPVLQKKSARRMQNNPLWSIIGQKISSPHESAALAKKANDLQMAEAIAIEEDLLQLCRQDGSQLPVLRQPDAKDRDSSIERKAEK